MNTFFETYNNLFPALISSAVTVGAYFVFVFCQSALLAAVMLIMSALQCVPPIVSRKYTRINYESCRETEAKLSDFTISAYRGFTDIKLLKLRDWWIGKLKLLHREYFKTGNASIAANSAESMIETAVESLLKYGFFVIVGIVTFFKISSIDAAIQTIALAGSFFRR